MTLSRLTAQCLSLIVAAALIGQFILNGALPEVQHWGLRIWGLMRYFTILTNGLVAVLMARHVLGQKVSADWYMTAALSIAMVGVIYQTLLVPPVPLTGAAWATDFAFHAAVPVLAVLWWIAFAPKPPSLATLPLWLLWPLGYCLYALIRGGAEGRYPYFFVDVGQYGLARVMVNVAGLIVVFAVAGAALWALGRRSIR